MWRNPPQNWTGDRKANRTYWEIPLSLIHILEGYAKQQTKEATEIQNALQFIQNDGIIKASSGLPKRVSLPDEVLKATAEVDLPNIHGVVPTGSTVSEVYVMAGTGTSIPIRDLKRLYALYPEAGPPSGWQKKSGTVVTENFRYIVHWYENCLLYTSFNAIKYMFLTRVEKMQKFVLPVLPYPKKPITTGFEGVTQTKIFVLPCVICVTYKVMEAI